MECLDLSISCAFRTVCFLVYKIHLNKKKILCMCLEKTLHASNKGHLCGGEGKWWTGMRRRWRNLLLFPLNYSIWLKFLIISINYL